MKKYFPILLPKAGELSALANLSDNVKKEISPILEILDKLPDPLLIKNMWSFENNQILIDFSIFELRFDRTAITRFFDSLFANGINVIPVIQENSNPTYLNIVGSLIANYDCKVAIRGSNGSGGFANFNNVIA